MDHGSITQSMDRSIDLPISLSTVLQSDLSMCCDVGKILIWSVVGIFQLAFLIRFF